VRLPVNVIVEPRDRHRAVLFVALVGLMAALVMALAGLPPVDLHGPLHRHGIMDPLCGGTRALRLAARGHLLRAVQWNPASPLLLLGAVAFVSRTLIGYLTGSWANLRISWRRPSFWMPLVVALVALEVRQQHLAPMLLREGY